MRRDRNCSFVAMSCLDGLTMATVLHRRILSSRAAHCRDARTEASFNADAAGRSHQPASKFLAVGASGDASFSQELAMPSRRTILRAGPLVVESRLTTRDLGGFDAADANESASERVHDDRLAYVTGPFRARVASASGWAALLFSSWRHVKYHMPNISGADRVRAFIRGDLLDARRRHRAS
jgi:hypothetical protein